MDEYKESEGNNNTSNNSTDGRLSLPGRGFTFVLAGSPRSWPQLATPKGLLVHVQVLFGAAEGTSTSAPSSVKCLKMYSGDQPGVAGGRW